MNAISRVERQREIEEERVEPDTAEGDGLEAVISFVGEVCALIATFEEEVNEVIDIGGAGRYGWWLPVTGCAPLRSGLGFRFWWGARLTVNLVLRAVDPHLYI